MSDSDVSALPSDARIEKALRNTVSEIFGSGNLDDLTLKRVRNLTEKQLDLPEDFFKTSSTWKDKSKTIVTAQVEALENEPEEQVGSPPTKKKSQPAPAIKATKKSAPPKSAKRPSPSPASKPAKRRKVVAASESEDEEGEEGEDIKNHTLANNQEETSPVKPKRSSPPPVADHDESELSDVIDEPPKKTKKTAAKKQTKAPVADEDESELSDVIDEPPKKKRAPAKKAAKATAKTAERKTSTKEAEAGSESELSSVIDEPPPKKRGPRKSSTTEGSKKTSKQKGKAPKAKEGLDPQEAEIKRLQGWLIKCGIRKMWHRELAPYDTPKAKINHLKDMLKEAGMDGRYSVEKARQIKERRELAADLEAVQEGAKRWGQSASEEEDQEEEDEARPRRRLARGFKNLAFLGDEGEETD